MKLPIAEIFESIQGEGTQAGMPALFVRLAGCNLWNGQESGREKGTGNCSTWCDTDFIKKFFLTVPQLSEIIYKYVQDKKNALVVFTGGEPTLHHKKLEPLCQNLLMDKINVSVETNGTRDCYLLEMLYEHKFGHVVCSPKKTKQPEFGINVEPYKHIRIKRCNDLKIVYPTNTDAFGYFKKQNITYHRLFIQPLDMGDCGKGIIKQCLNYATLVGGTISVQTHKLMDLR